MPQLDSVTYFSQIFWFFIFFFSFYFLVLNNILENVFKVFRVRFFYLNNSRAYFFDICKQNVIFSKFMTNYYSSFFKILFFFSKEILENKISNVILKLV
jgi:hypothetical protein